jgi:hypothetical protein
LSQLHAALSNKKAGSDILGLNAMRHFQTKRREVEILCSNAMRHVLSNKKAGSEILGLNAMRFFQIKRREVIIWALMPCDTFK